MKSKKSELRLLIKEENKPLLQEIAANMSDASLTSALNFVLETQGETVLEQIKTIKGNKNPNVVPQRSIPGHQNSIPERQSSIPELDGTAVESAFD